MLKPAYSAGMLLLTVNIIHEKIYSSCQVGKVDLSIKISGSENSTTTKEEICQFFLRYSRQQERRCASS
jgi:hypothetical protein